MFIFLIFILNLTRKFLVGISVCPRINFDTSSRQHYFGELFLDVRRYFA